MSIPHPDGYDSLITQSAVWSERSVREPAIRLSAAQIYLKYSMLQKIGHEEMEVAEKPSESRPEGLVRHESELIVSCGDGMASSASK